MSTLVFPPSLTPAKLDWSLDRGGIVNRGLLSAGTQRVDFGFQAWRASVGMPTLTGEDAAIFQSFMDQACRFDRHFYFSFPQTLRGSFDNSELLTNGDFTDGTDGWFGWATYSTLTSGSRLMKVEVTSTTGNAGAFQDVSTITNHAYVYTVHTLPGSSADVSMQVVRTNDSVDHFPFSNAIPYGLFVTSFLENYVGLPVVRIRFGNGETFVGKTMYTQHASVSRCLLVNGASQTGSTLNVDAGDASTNGLLKVNDMFTVMIDDVPSLHRLTRDLDTNSSGEGTLYFEPPLPGAPDDNAPIILNKPFCRMFIPEHSTSAMFTPPMLMGSAFDCVEDPTR